MEKFKFCPASRTLTITSNFAKALLKDNSEEYALLLRLQQDFPGLKVVQRTHATPSKYKNKNGEITSRNQFKNLTYENMERFMAALPNGEKFMAEYQFLRNEAADLQINGYAFVRKWFLAQFPLYRSNPLAYLGGNLTVLPAAPFFQEEESAIQAEWPAENENDAA